MYSYSLDSFYLMTQIFRLFSLKSREMEQSPPLCVMWHTKANNTIRIHGVVWNEGGSEVPGSAGCADGGGGSPDGLLLNIRAAAVCVDGATKQFLDKYVRGSPQYFTLICRQDIHLIHVSILWCFKSSSLEASEPHQGQWPGHVTKVIAPC